MWVKSPYLNYTGALRIKKKVEKLNRLTSPVLEKKKVEKYEFSVYIRSDCQIE